PAASDLRLSAPDLDPPLHEVSVVACEDPEVRILGTPQARRNTTKSGRYPSRVALRGASKSMTHDVPLWLYPRVTRPRPPSQACRSVINPHTPRASSAGQDCPEWR